MADLRIAVGWYLSYGSKPGEWDRKKLLAAAAPKSLFKPVDPNGFVKVVKILCNGDLKTLGPIKFQAVTIKATHPILGDKPSGITKYMGLPLIVHKCDPKRVYHPSSSTQNQDGTFLDRMVTNDEWFGAAPICWQNNVGSVLVARADGKDISPQ